MFLFFDNICNLTEIQSLLFCAPSLAVPMQPDLTAVRSSKLYESNKEHVALTYRKLIQNNRGRLLHPV